MNGVLKMADQITNMEKYENYREQMGRLKKAIGSGFFLEAIFIEYAVMEDRLTSVLIHAGHWTSTPDEHVTINKKLHLIDKLRENKNNRLIHKYFPPELTDSVSAWKDKRNPYIHDLLNRKITTDDLEEFALKGQEIVKKLCNASTNYSRALQRQADKK